MVKIRKIALRLLYIIGILYVLVCAFFYFEQDSILFIPTKLAADHRFVFAGKFAEQKIASTDGAELSTVLFTTDTPKGVILYLHGNGGCTESWGRVAPLYTAAGYDVLLVDYRGYGKSTGAISSERQLYDDVQAAYNWLQQRYGENKINVLGYSIGTGPAAMLAARNHPHRLILQAPYYSMVDMMRNTYPFLPTPMLKYPLRTDEFLQKVQCPITVFHGDADEVIYYGSSVKLSKYFKPGDTLITLSGQGHNGMTDNVHYGELVKLILK